MKCVIFTGGGLPQKESALHYLKNCDFCVAADSGLIAAENFGFLPDLVVGDFDSLAEQGSSALRLLEKYPENRIRRWKKDKDYTDTELALAETAEEARKRSAADPHITLVGGSGGRADHFLALCALFDKPLHPNIWLCAEQALYCLDSRLKNSSSLTLYGLTEGDAVSIFAVSGRNPHLSSDGLRWNIDKLEWKKGAFSLSNRISAEYAAKKAPVNIRTLSGTFLVTAPLKTSC